MYLPRSFRFASTVSIRGVSLWKIVTVAAGWICIAAIFRYQYSDRGTTGLHAYKTPALVQETDIGNSTDSADLTDLAAFSAVVQALESDFDSRRLHWIKVEDAVDSSVPTQFQSAGFYDWTLLKFKFYITGYPENRPLFCRLYTVDHDQVITQIRSVAKHVTDADRLGDREIAGGVAVCDKAIATSEGFLLHYFSSKTRDVFDNFTSTAPAVLGVLTYSSDVPTPRTVKAQLVLYSQHKNVSLLMRLPQESNDTQRNLSAVSKPTVLVCVKATTADPAHPINPVQLVEWLEYTRLFKADRVVFYAYTRGPRRLSNDTLKVLRFYESTGFVQLWMSDYIVASAKAELGWTITLFLHAPSLNLCVDANRHQFDYVAVYDVDEIWVPLLNDSYPSLIARLAAQHGHRPFTFTNWPFYTELPHTTNDSSVPISQRYFYRANMSHISWKTVSPVSQCFVAHNHYCVRTYPNQNSPSGIRVPEHVAVLHHHTYCWNHRPQSECQLAFSTPYVVRDESLLRYATEITSAVNHTVSTLNNLKFDEAAALLSV